MFRRSKIFNTIKYLDFKDCDVCERNFNETLKEKSKIIIFKCIHIEHEDCSLKGGTSYCWDKVSPICIKKEIEDFIICNPDDPRSKLSLDDFMKSNRGSIHKNTYNEKKFLNE